MDDFLRTLCTIAIGSIKVQVRTHCMKPSATVIQNCRYRCHNWGHS